MRQVLTSLTIFWIFFICGIASAFDGNFIPNNEIPVGSMPFSICAGDFNGDLANDLAVANWGDATVSVLINNGDGTFQTAVSYDVGGWPRDLIAGQFLGDAEIDLAVLSWDPNGFTVLVGKGDGTFWDTLGYHPTGMDLPSGPYSICSGDFDNDSYNDIAIAYDNTDNIGVYINENDTSFTYFWKYAVGDHPQDVISYDLDSDDYDDLMVVNYFDKTISVLLGQGTGAFDTPVNYTSSGAGAFQICLADLVGDANPDIVGGVGGTFGGYDIFTGNGDGTFGTALYTDSVGYTSKIYATDLDNDTDIDLIFAEVATDSIVIVLNEGGGTFSDPVRYYATGEAANIMFVCAVDLNGDTYPDIAVANSGLDNITVLMNDGSGGFMTGVNSENQFSQLPEDYSLSDNYPNPFNPGTIIKYSIPTKSHVSIDVVNILGQKVVTLVNEIKPAGNYQISWNGNDTKGNKAATGIYLYRLRAGDFVDIKKMILLR